MNTEEVIECLMSEHGCGAHEMAEVRFFKGYRRNATGEVVAITVEIHDSGRSAGGIRYMVIAHDEKGRTTTGNPCESIEVALDICHWDKLDTDDYIDAARAAR